MSEHGVESEIKYYGIFHSRNDNDFIYKLIYRDKPNVLFLKIVIRSILVKNSLWPKNRVESISTALMIGSHSYGMSDSQPFSISCNVYYGLRAMWANGKCRNGKWSFLCPNWNKTNKLFVGNSCQSQNSNLSCMLFRQQTSIPIDWPAAKATPCAVVSSSLVRTGNDQNPLISNFIKLNLMNWINTNTL